MIGHGGLCRAFSVARKIRGSGHVYEIYPQTCPDRQPDTWVSLCNLMLKLRGILRSIPGSDSPHSNNRKGNSIHSP